MVEYQLCTLCARLVLLQRLVRLPLKTAQVTIGTGTIPVTSANGGVVVATGMHTDADSDLSAGDVIEIEFDGSSGAGAGDMVVQFVQSF